MEAVGRRAVLLGAGATAVGAGAASVRSAAEPHKGAPPRRREDSEAGINADPLAYLGNIRVLATFPIRIDRTRTWLQGVGINERDGHIYVSNQITGGTELRIDIRTMDGSYVSSKSFPIEAEAFTEALPWWIGENGDLCFMVRTEAGESYAIFNYTSGVLGDPIPIRGRAKAAVDGGYLITSDLWVNGVSRIYVYDWASVRSGEPDLLHTIFLDSAQPLSEKSQGLALNGGYILLLQGKSEGNPTITVYNAGGHLVHALQFDKQSFAEALNDQVPKLIGNPADYHYENEAGCIYQGKLVTASVVWDGDDTFTAKVVLTVHNEPDGTRVAANIPPVSHDTGWREIALSEGIEAYADDTVPRWRRVGNVVYASGAAKGIEGAPSKTVIAVLPEVARPDRNLQWAAPTSNNAQCNWQMSSNGDLRIESTTNPDPDEETWYPFATSWIAR